MGDVGPPAGGYEELAKIIDHTLLDAALTEEEVAEGCALARAYGVASVLVRPSDVELTAGWMESSGVAVGTVVGYPHGSSTTSAKLYELRDLLRRGAREIEAVINLGKIRSRQFSYLEMEWMQMAKACHDSGAVLRLVLESHRLADDLRIIGVKIARRAEVDTVVNATVGGPPVNLDDLRFLVGRLEPLVKVKASPVATLDEALAAREAGCSRLGATATAAILDAFKARLAEAARQAQAVAPPAPA